MTVPRTIALVSPLAWPPSNEVTHRIDAEARALAARGHRVSVLTPTRGADLLARGRRMLASVRAGDIDAVIAPPGEVRIVPLGRAALPTGSHRRIGGPLDLAAALEDVLSRVPFDVVHVHEPFSPTPALSALKNARGVTAATLHRVEPVTGVAFLRPIVERAVDRVDVWIAATEPARRAVAEHFDREATVIPPGVDTRRFVPADEPVSPAPVVIVAREPDGEGIRFGLAALRAAGDAVAVAGPITVLAPAHAPRRTTASVPKALRAEVTIIPDTGPAARQGVFPRGGIALFTTVDDLAGSAVVEAMACGMTVLVPRSPEADTLIAHGQTGIALTPFSRDEWGAAITELLTDEPRRLTIADAAAVAARAHDWDRVAETLERAYDEARTRPRRRPATERIVADLRVHPSRSLTPRDLLAACSARGVTAVAVIGEGDLTVAKEAAGLAPAQLTVVVGQQIRTAQGEIVGLFLERAVPEGRPLDESIAAVEDQGGVVMIPHPVWGEAPSPAAIREMGARIGCVEALSGPGSLMRSTFGIEDARLMQTFGLRITAGSGAVRADQIGSAHMRMAPFHDARSFLEALEDAEPVQQRRGLRPATHRERRRGNDTNT